MIRLELFNKIKASKVVSTITWIAAGIAAIFSIGGGKYLNQCQ